MSNNYCFDLGSYRRPVTTKSADAQLWFDRGLLWSHAFNHEEAVRCFTKATEYDEDCAMAYWGIAYARGPNYNKAWIRFDPLDLETTFKEMPPVLQRAQQLATQATPVEAALIKALVARYPQAGVPEDLSTLDRAFVKAMRPVYNSFPDDLDVAGLFVESLMCLSPRALWDLYTGKPCGPHTTEAREVLERAMSLPGGTEQPAFQHLYIHLMEMSPFPEVALPAADRMRGLIPDGSHLLHMPTHIYVACGDYRSVVDFNRDAMLVDDKYFAREKASILYVMYRAHNMYVRIYGAIISGRFNDALSTFEHLQEVLTPELLSISSPPMADWTESYLGAIAHIFIRFGRWNDILNLPIPEDQTLYCSTTATIYYARGIALAVLDRIDEAKVEQGKFEAACADVPQSRQSSFPVREIDVLKVASVMLRGEIQYRQGHFDSAFSTLRSATVLEDGLHYADPPPWMQPSRHALGALLLEQGHVKQAQLVYEEDLGMSKTLPRRKARLNNVWGLHGLYECLTQQGDDDKARYIQNQRDVALASADVPIKASCFCRLSALGNNVFCC